MSEYFCVFTKKGILLHESGNCPSYRNNLIQSLNVHKSLQSRTIQDSFMYCNINKDMLYLAILKHQNEEYFLKLVDEFKNGKKDKLKDKQDDKKIKNKENKQRKWDVVDDDPSLDFSSKDTSIKFNNEIIDKKIEKKSYSFNLFSKFIKKTDLKEKMETHLINKNLSVDITKQLIQDITEDLPEDVKESVFKQKIKEVVRKMIRSIDHKDLLDQIKKKEIFVFCFVGVNGVGKSTTLAKICCWLLQNNLKVYIAACDTFRAGAVEQLKVHVDNFKRGGYEVGFYEKGYNKDDANVAKNAIKSAEKENYDVILIDTAGRMHNKKNLMESLSKLIKVNEIDHIIFVGEALVGNDSLEHLKEFNNAIKYGNNQKCIDSIIVSKVDTVDDKIGQVINMSVGGECPVLFLGTGQTNSSLTILNTELIVDLLMS